jgi:hypothetical protein
VSDSGATNVPKPLSRLSRQRALAGKSRHAVSVRDASIVRSLRSKRIAWTFAAGSRLGERSGREERSIRLRVLATSTPNVWALEPSQCLNPPESDRTRTYACHGSSPRNPRYAGLKVINHAEACLIRVGEVPSSDLGAAIRTVPAKGGVVGHWLVGDSPWAPVDWPCCALSVPKPRLAPRRPRGYRLRRRRAG